MDKKNNRGCSTIFVFLLFIIIGYYCYTEYITPSSLDEEVKEEKKEEHTRTIMIYMAPSDLESKWGYATDDLNAINNEIFDFDHNKIVIMAGGTNTWHNNFTKETSIYEYTKDGIKKIGSAGNYQNMGDYKTLTYFLNFVKNVSTYNSEEYILYFYGHGYGVSGVLPDEIYDDNISLTDLAFAISNSSFNYLDNGKRMLDLVIFNSCMMGTFETYQTLNIFSKYVIASEDLTWFVKGTPLFSVLNDFKSEDDIETIGKKYIDKYKEIANKVYGNHSHNLSLVDTSKFNYSSLYLSNLFNKININIDYEKVKNIRKTMKEFGDEKYIDEVDMYTMMNLFKNYDTDSYNNFKKEFEETVIYNFTNSSEMNGISIHFPYFDCTDKEYYMIYNTSLVQYQNNGYYNFIAKFVDKMKKECNYE